MPDEPRAPTDDMSPEAQSDPTDNEIFDGDASLARLDGDVVVLKELAGMFVDRAAGLVDNLRRALHERDQPASRQATHALIGGMSSFHAARATAAAVHLQDAIKAAEWSRADERLEKLLVDVHRLAASLQRFSDDG